MISFTNFLSESKSNIIFSFKYENENISFSGKSKKELYCKVLDWLYNIGYDFSEAKSDGIIISLEDIKSIVSKTKYRIDHFYNISNSNNFIKILSPGTGYLNKGGLIYNMLLELGCKDLILSNEDVEVTSISKKMTFIEAAQHILKQNGNKPMNALEIWEEANAQNLVETLGKTPKATMNAQMIVYSDNTTAIGKKKNSIFRIIEDKPYKFILLNPELEVQSIPDEDVILPPSEFIQKVEKPKDYVKNPFRQSICVLGESGAGKSTTLEHILEFEGHEFEFIIPSASTTGLLSQFSPSRSGYIQSRLGKMIVEAFNNPTTLYTAVFDECHKSNVIEMINDELLQAISTKRNMGRRFISLDEDTSELYKGVGTFRGNILIPDNFGFIFISSKPRIIANNTDFFNRVDLVVLKSYEEEKIQTSKELLSKVLPYEEKIKLASTRND